MNKTIFLSSLLVFLSSLSANALDMPNGEYISNGESQFYKYQLGDKPNFLMSSAGDTKVITTFGDEKLSIPLAPKYSESKSFVGWKIIEKLKEKNVDSAFMSSLEKAAVI